MDGHSTDTRGHENASLHSGKAGLCPSGVRISEATIKKLEPPERGNRITYDSEVTGFGLRVTVAGAKAFVLGYRFEGRERRLTIGRWPEWTATAARERAKELRQMIDRGEDPLTEKQARREAPTVEEIARDYLTRHAAKKKSAKIMREYIERDILPVWGKWKAVDVRRRDVIALVERKAQSTPVAGNMLLSIVRGLFNWAIENEYELEQNPAYRVKAPAEKKPRDRWLNEGEIRVVWEKLDTAKMAPESRAALRLILITAQRPGEVLGAEWSEIETEAGLWIIPAARAKNGIQHTVPLSTLALEELARLSRAERWLIPSWYTEGHMTVAGLSNAVSVNQKHFGIARWTPHDLRRTAATQMAKAGVPRFTISRVLNHADKSITATYERHSYDPEKKTALEKWERELRRIVGSPRAAKVVEMTR